MRIRRLVKRISYKPNSKFTIERLDNGLTIGCHLYVEDTVNRGTYRWIDSYIYIHQDSAALRSDGDILREIMWYMGGLELHEVYEWLCLDGEHIFPPHPEHPMSGEYPRALGVELKMKLLEVKIGE